jgi:hypothetical protein
MFGMYNSTRNVATRLAAIRSRSDGVTSVCGTTPKNSRGGRCAEALAADANPASASAQARVTSAAARTREPPASVING